MKLRRTFKVAALSLRGNLLRSALTALGVVIGIAAVVVVASIAEGSRRDIDAMMASLGSNRIDVESGARRGVVGARLMFGGLYSLTDADAEAIRSADPNILALSSVLRGSAQLVAGSSSWTAGWQGVSGDFFSVNRFAIASGRQFTAHEYRSGTRVVVLGETVRERLFGESKAVGRSVRVNNSSFLVVGVMEKKGLGGFNQDLDDTVVVPLSVGRRLLMGDFPIPRTAVQAISIQVLDIGRIVETQEKIDALLRKRHRIAAAGEEDFKVGTVSDLIAGRSQSTQILSSLLAAVAGICLLVGGIGVMNMMLVAVTERIHEIGLRMAVGASPADIRAQFLAEAALITVIGGAAGTILGVIGAVALAHVTSTSVHVNFLTIAVATAFSVGTGLLFGYLPAKKASQLSPVRALGSR